MLRHYVFTTLRGWRHAPWATVVNVLTLALGLGCFVVAYAVTDYLGSQKGGGNLGYKKPDA